MMSWVKLVGIFGIVLLVYGALMLSSPEARSGYNHRLLAQRIGFDGILVLGVALVIICGGIDLSIGSVVGLSAVSLALLLAFATGLVKNLPSAALAAVVMAAVVRLIDVDTLRRLWRVRRSEAAVALAGFLGVTLLGVLPGIGVAVGLSLLIFLRRAWRPHDTVLGRVTGMKGYTTSSGILRQCRFPDSSCTASTRHSSLQTPTTSRTRSFGSCVRARRRSHG